MPIQQPKTPIAVQDGEAKNQPSSKDQENEGQILQGFRGAIDDLKADVKTLQKSRVEWQHWVIGLFVSAVFVTIFGPIGAYYLTIERDITKIATRNEQQLKDEQNKLTTLQQELRQTERQIEANHNYIEQQKGILQYQNQVAKKHKK